MLVHTLTAPGALLGGTVHARRVSYPRAYRAACADLLLGERCVGCSQPGQALCRPCAAELETMPTRHAPSPCPDTLPPLYCVSAYDGVAKEALVAHKERTRLSLTRPLGRALALSVLGVLSDVADRAQTPLGIVHLVPAPSRRAVVRRRGHDPLLRMSRECARELRAGGVACVVSPVLRVSRRVTDQSELDEVGRRANVRHAFAATGRSTSTRWDVVLVDDIVTTGSTIAEMTRALDVAGVGVVGAAVVAATQRRGSGSR